jgi:maltose alpha-D-glucosyltransferase / alpha-amylase
MATKNSKYYWRDDDPLWYKDAIIYELHVRAFYDSDGDGTGDFPGLTQKLDYLQDLGVTAIWLLPFYPSPFKDDGYDVANYTSVYPGYGSIKDIRNLIREANVRGLRVITELVLNHTSDQHIWFQKARRATPGSPAHQFYVWSDNQNKYKEARIIFKDFEHSNWAWDPVAGCYYWHRFYSYQPDLNYNNPEVRQEIQKVINFWLSMGVSGLRLDAIPYLYEQEGTNCENLPETHAYIKQLRKKVDSRFQNRMLLAEANQWAEDAVNYFGDGDECHMAYHFPLMPRMFMAIRMEDRFPVIDILQNSPSIPDTCQWALFLRNHDELTLEMVTDEERDYMYRVYAYDSQARINLGIRRRLAPLLNNDRKKIELMNCLLFSLPGTPILYYGDEIGMGDNIFLGDRDGVRTPMQWSSDRNAGFSRANPQKLYLPVNIDPEYHFEACNVENQQNNPDSLLWWMKRLISARKRYKAISRGSLKFLQPPNRKILAFIRRFGDENILVVANLSRHAQHTGLNLADLEGLTPVEIFGKAEFPVIGESTYQLTLGPYSFYWFSLERSPDEQIAVTTPRVKAVVPELIASQNWKNLYTKTKKPVFAAALTQYATGKRWYAGKSRQIISTTIEEYINVPANGSEYHVIMLRIDYTEDEPETYQIPVGFALAEQADKIMNDTPQAVISSTKLKTRNDEKQGVVYDATISRHFHEMFLDAIGRRRRFKGEKGELVADNSRRLFSILRKPAKETLESFLLQGEQSNTSFTYGDRFKFKLLRRLEEGISPELEIGRFFTETQMFSNTPPVAGFVEYRRRWKEPVTLGILHGYVQNEGDAWRYTLDSLGQFFDRVLVHQGIEIQMPAGTSLLDNAGETIPEEIGSLIGPYLNSAQLLGQRTAEMHLAFGSAVDDPNFVPEPFSITYQRALFHGMRSFARQVMQRLDGRIRYLPEDAKENASKLVKLENSIIEKYREITRYKITGMRIRLHGDYHLGQILYTGNDFVIIDYEGEPARHLGERRIKRTPLRDIASMIRSFHYAAYVALYGQTSTLLREEDMPVLEKWAVCWYMWVASVFLNSYLEMMLDSPILPSTMDGQRTLLDAYLLDKAVYEINYELNNRPDWIGLPVRGILQVLGIENEPPGRKTIQKTGRVSKEEVLESVPQDAKVQPGKKGE